MNYAPLEEIVNTRDLAAHRRVAFYVYLVVFAMLCAACVGCGNSPTEPFVHAAGADPLPTPTPSTSFGPGYPTCPAGSTYDVQERACTTPARCPPGYYWELYVGCQWPSGAGPEPTPRPNP